MDLNLWWLVLPDLLEQQYNKNPSYNKYEVLPSLDILGTLDKCEVGKVKAIQAERIQSIVWTM